MPASPPRRPDPLKGHGAASNPPNRFDRLHYEPEAAEDVGLEPEELEPDLDVRYLRDPSRSIVATNDSPDVGFDASVNPYRGCTHACAYCFARPTHEYLGFSAGLDFETRILVKEDAPALLRRALAAKSWQPRVVALSGVTDAYQPIERRLGITRRCLEVLAAFRNPVAIVTKSRLVARDADLLGELARFDAASVWISITTLDPELQRRMEPRAPRPSLRLAAIEALAKAGVPVGVLVAPVVPGLTEHEMPGILRAAAEAGARHAGYVVLRLPHGVKELVDEWLVRHYPERRDKVLNRVRALRGGRLYDSRFATRQRGEGAFADQIAQLFAMGRRRAGIADERPALSTAHFRRPPDAGAPQLSLFEPGQG
jgi:DNA repair photolyase